MGFWSDLFAGESGGQIPVGVYTPDAPLAIQEFHPHTLQGMRVASELQYTGTSLSDFKVSAVYRGAQLLADLTAQLPWHAYEGGDPTLTMQSVLEEATRLDPQPQILLNPDVVTDRDDMLRQIVLSLIFHGNAYLYGSMMDRDGRPTNVTVANSNEVAVSSNAGNTRPVYSWRGQSMQLGVNWWHLSLNRPPGQWTGVGPLMAGSEIVNGIRNADRYARDLFANSGTPSGVLKVPGKLTKDEAERLKEQWDRQHAGGRGTAILSGGIEFEGIALTPEQAQFLSTRAYGSQEVARLLGIPQWFLNAGSPPGTASALTYQNLNQVFVELTRSTLYPTYLRRIEKMFSRLLPRGQMVKFDTSEFLATDAESRYRGYQVALEAGFMTVDEVRAHEGLKTGVAIVPPIVRTASGRRIANPDQQEVEIDG
jgi:HK97 family phage portal protein